MPHCRICLLEADRTAEGGAFLDGAGDRLFKIDVFAGCQGIDRHAHMPVVGRGDNDGVDLLLQDFAIIHVVVAMPLERSLMASRRGP